MDENGYKDKYLEEKFKGVYSRLDIVLQKLNDYELDSREINKRVSGLERVQLQCPVKDLGKDVEELKKDTEELRFFNRNPEKARAFKIGERIIMFLNTAGVVYALLMLYKLINEIRQ